MSRDDRTRISRQPAAPPERRGLTDPPGFEGGAFYFEVRPGWETRILRDDNKVTTVLSPAHLNEALGDVSILTIFIPGDALIGREKARLACRYGGHGKTVFFEVGSSE